MNVFLLHHIREDDEYGDDAKLIGVYSSETNAAAAIERLKAQPGFCEFPAGFQIDRYELDKDNWIEGFVSAQNR